MNYANTIQKCITELKSENPRIDYVLGMLEVLAEMSDKPLQIRTDISIPTPTYEKHILPIRTETISDEEKLPEFLKPGPRGNI